MNHYDPNWNEIEEKIYQHYKKLVTGNEKEYLHNQIIEFSNMFKQYLIREEKKASYITLDSKVQNKFNSADLILSFNYTKTYEHYNKGMKVLHWHALENPVIGYYTEEEKDSIDGLLKDKTNRRVYLEDNKKINKISFLKKSNKIENVEVKTDKKNEITPIMAANFQEIRKFEKKINEITIIGHSFGSSDKCLFEKIFKYLLTNQNIKINIFDYKGDSFKVASNIFELSGEKLYNFGHISYADKDVIKN